MKKKVMSVLLAAALFTGCAVTPQTEESHIEEPAVSDPAPTEEIVDYPAVLTSYEDLRDGDRFILVNEDRMRVLTSVAEKEAFVGACVNGGKDRLTHIPDQSMVMTMEHTENGGFRMKTDGGYLTSYKDGYGLYLNQEPTACGEWEATPDGTILCVGASLEKNGETEKLYLYHYRYENDFITKENPENDPERCVTLFYRVADTWIPTKDDGSGYRLPVYETSDIHGYIAAFAEGFRTYRMAEFAGRINEARMRSGTMRDDTVVLLDGGDQFQGSTLSNLLEGRPVLETFAAMRYDAVTIGNHEFDWGIETVLDPDGTLSDNGSENGNHIPVVLSNLYQNGEKTPWAKDYVILEKTALDREGNELPVRIGVIGFSEDYGSSIQDSLFQDLNFEIRDDYNSLYELARELREREHCDAVILLAHTDVSLAAAHMSENAGIDLVLGGHMHFSDFGVTDSGVPFVMPAGNAMAMSNAELIFGRDEDGSPVFERCTEPSLIASSEEESPDCIDPEIQRISDEAIDSLIAVMDEPIGTISVDVLTDEFFPESGKRSSTGGNWYSSLLARTAKADIGFINRYGMRQAFLLEPGETEMVITVGDVYSMFPFGNDVYRFDLTYEELLKVFDYALSEDGALLFSMMSGIDCYYEGNRVLALVKDGETVYHLGKSTTPD